MFKKLALIAASGAVAIAVALPAIAPAVSKCPQHKVAYIAHGTYVSADGTLAPGTYTGDLSIYLTSANRHFTDYTGLTVVHKGTKTLATYTAPTSINDANVKFSSAVKKQGLRAGDRVTLTGTILVESGKGCTSPNTVVITHIYVSSKTGT